MKLKVLPTDSLIVRTDYSEQSFTGNELATAQGIANIYAARGQRVALIHYAYRPNAKKANRTSPHVLFANKGMQVFRKAA